MESSLVVGIPCCFTGDSSLDLFFELLLLKNLECHVKDCGIVEHYDAAVGTWLDVNAHVDAEVIV